MVLYGLIGYPLTHSRSVELFNRIFHEKELRDRKYSLFPLRDLRQLPGFIRDHPDLSGFNVTIPWKERIILYLDELDETARQIGAVNTVLVARQKSHAFLKGYNTDASGFLRSMDFSGYDHALILGTGGAAKAVAFALRQVGIGFRFVSRNSRHDSTIRYSEITEQFLGSCRMIINATPLGMYPDAASFPPIPYHWLTPSHFLYDLVYNPGMTTFLKKGADQGAQIQNGERMLMLQAEEAWRIWNGR